MDEQDYAKYICGIRTNNFKRNEFKSTDGIWDVTNLKNINFFIGQNNSGKSRLLRSIITSTNYEVNITNLDSITLINNVISNANSDSISNMNNLRSTYVSSISDEEKKSITIENIKVELSKAIEKGYKQLYGGFDSNDLSTFMNSFYRKYLKIDNFEFYQKVDFGVFGKIYIPLLRGLRPLNEDKDLYQERTHSDYFAKSKDRVFDSKSIFTGYTIYKEIKSALLGTHIERIKLREFEKYLSVHFFNCNEIALIPRIDEDVVYLKEGDKEERRIADLGDGLQSIIILTFKVFMTERPTAFFIEEAEQHLHAGMQRALVNAFSRHKQHIYFITTHSNHFVDIAQELDCVSLNRVYQQIEDGKEVSYVDSLSEKSEMLADLGVRASSVLLANCSIWVEGITDKLYISAFMSKYIDELTDDNRAEKLRNYKENLHYIFTEYQGGNITHWDFSQNDNGQNYKTKAKALSSNILLIADNDISSKAERVDTLKSDLGDRFHLLPYKEIENHIPIEIIKETANKRWETFISKGEASFCIEKLTQSNLQHNFGIGTVLERYVKDNDSERKFFADASGTVKDKVKFCTTAVSSMNDLNVQWQLTPELTSLCSLIWDHIEKCNLQ
jgi:AAA15 family ATPase/GTPase